VTDLVVDTSAVVAMLLDEKGAEELRERLASADSRLMSMTTLVELGIVIEARLGPAGASLVERFVRDAGIELVDVDRAQADRALEGWRSYGKGRHPAALNFGGCFTYALAASAEHPILCVGDDFAATDLEVVRPGGD
jgi:ribonuclease VapC